MQIKYFFDQSLIEDYYSQDKWLLFHIFCIHEGHVYPDENWLDFGVVMLREWLPPARRLLQGSLYEEFLFFDGPFCLNARKQGDILHITLSDSLEQWLVPLDSFVQEIVHTAKQVHSDLLQMGVSRGINKRYLDKIESLCREIDDILKTQKKAD